MSGFLREKRRGISPPLGGPGSFDQPMIILIISLIPIKARKTMNRRNLTCSTDYLEAIEEWLRGILSGMILNNLGSMYADVNAKTATIAAEVGTTPAGWNASIYGLIKNLSDSAKLCPNLKATKASKNVRHCKAKCRLPK